MKYLSILIGALFLLSLASALDVSEELSSNVILDEYNNFQKTDRNIFLYDTKNIDSFQKQKKIENSQNLKIFENFHKNFYIFSK